MTELINKHQIKIQIGILVGCVIAFAAFIASASGYAHQIDVNTGRLNTVEAKLDQLATKVDLEKVSDGVDYLIRLHVK
jgi:hypothetical protein